MLHKKGKMGQHIKIRDNTGNLIGYLVNKSIFNENGDPIYFIEDNNVFMFSGEQVARIISGVMYPITINSSLSPRIKPSKMILSKTTKDTNTTKKIPVI